MTGRIVLFYVLHCFLQRISCFVWVTASYWRVRLWGAWSVERKFFFCRWIFLDWGVGKLYISKRWRAYGLEFELWYLLWQLNNDHLASNFRLRLVSSHSARFIHYLPRGWGDKRIATCHLGLKNSYRSVHWIVGLVRVDSNGRLLVISYVLFVQNQKVRNLFLMTSNVSRSGWEQIEKCYLLSFNYTVAILHSRGEYLKTMRQNDFQELTFVWFQIGHRSIQRHNWSCDWNTSRCYLPLSKGR